MFFLRWLDSVHEPFETTISKVITTWMGCLGNDENNDESIKVRISTRVVSMLRLLELCSGLLFILTYPMKQYI